MTGDAASLPGGEHQLLYCQTVGPTTFIVLRNDGSRKSLVLLLQLKQIYSEQLPNMPQHYMLRLLFDKYHQSIMAVAGEQEVIGGITFRDFVQPGFLEIAFCAVRSGHQVRGYGSALMAHLKEHAKRCRLYHILTMADNNAIVFFRKQGFSTDISLSERQWKGFVKEYDGVTLMECLIHGSMDYTDGGKALLAMQKAVLCSRIEELKQDHIRQKGLDLWKDGPGHVDCVSIPGLSGTSWARQHEAQRIAYEKWHPKMLQLLEAVRTHPRASRLMKHIDEAHQSDFPGILAKCNSGRFYITVEMFAADMRRLFAAVRPMDEKGVALVEASFKQGLAQALVALRTPDDLLDD
eukprot:GGOE01036567.1.p1 GENE.GGOE01036567.1~~GGOE01036567.1.p1  ORF type:complete len:350 (+),score=101.59 GGOE01036567.1:71-1120(+)